MAETTAPPQRYYFQIEGLNKEEIDHFYNELTNAYKDHEEVQVELLPEGRVRVKLSEEEKEERRIRYREGYRKRPHVIAQLELKKKDPNYIKERQDYAARKDVKEQKKKVAQMNALLLKTIKKRKPEIVKEIVGEAALKRKRLTSKGISKRTKRKTGTTEPIACH